jgi:MFS transporter, MHS family, shikimate and dehydroshikimate transport protein
MTAGSVAAGRSNVRLVALASTIGTTVEWYDFFLYGTVAGLVFGKLFFPKFDPVVGTLLAYVTFAVGFVARPFGAVVFGHFGDRVGRKSMLVLTLLIMGVATFLIGLLPTYAQIGVAATVMLLVLRIFQGFGLGGEWGGAVLMAAEYAPDKERGFYASWPQIGVPAGLALGTIVTTVLNQGGEDFFLTWGWRIAFLLSAILVIIGVYIRLKIFETPQFEQIREKQQIAHVPFTELWRGYWQNVLLGMGIRYIEGVGFNLYGVFMIAYLANTLKYPRAGALTAVTIASIVMIFFIPYWSRLSDRIGRRRVFAGGVIATGLLVYPAFWLMQQGLVWAWIAVAIPFGVAYAAIYGPEAALFSELFDTRVRYSGISFVYQFSGIFASGMTPIVATALIVAGGGAPWLVAGYVVVVSLISLICVLSIRRIYMDVPAEFPQALAPVAAP